MHVLADLKCLNIGMGGGGGGGGLALIFLIVPAKLVNYSYSKIKPFQ